MIMNSYIHIFFLFLYLYFIFIPFLFFGQLNGLGSNFIMKIVHFLSCSFRVYIYILAKPLDLNNLEPPDYQTSDSKSGNFFIE